MCLYTRNPHEWESQVCHLSIWPGTWSLVSETAHIRTCAVGLGEGLQVHRRKAVPILPWRVPMETSNISLLTRWSGWIWSGLGDGYLTTCIAPKLDCTTDCVLSHLDISSCERTGLETEMSNLSFMSCIFMPYLMPPFSMNQWNEQICFHNMKYYYLIIEKHICISWACLKN